MSATPSRKLIIYIFLLVGFIILLHYSGILKPVERALRSLTTPIMSKAHSLGNSLGYHLNFFEKKTEYRTLEKNYTELKEKFDIQTAQFKLIEIENNTLRKQLKFTQRSKIPGILAGIVSQETLNNEQTVLINKGSREGLKVGQPVIIDDGILIGTIIKTEEDIAIIRLLNDSQSRVGARVLNKTQSLGVVEGGFRVSLRMNLIPRDETVLVGDQIVTSGIEDGVPPGLLIGTVAVVENEPYQPFQQAILTPGVDYNKLGVVKVLTVSGV